jgi:metal-dependent amidase/aminoacylase/carboxypeptidase family protein
MVQAFQTIITRNKKPTDTGVVSVTTIHTGEATNVVPDSAHIEGTVRTFTLPVLDLIEQRMREIAQHTAAAFGATVEFRFHRNYPPTVNHAAEAEFVAGVMRDTVGAENTLAFEPSMTAEDFSYFLLEKPGAYFVIGNGDGRHRLAYSGDAADTSAGENLGPCTLHNPHYDFNDDLIPLGGTLWIRLVEKWFHRPSRS